MKSVLTLYYLWKVAPHAGAWIEMETASARWSQSRKSPPTRGAWIEISTRCMGRVQRQVAPHAGAWIEITVQRSATNALLVAPHAGAWIEMHKYLPNLYKLKWSPPTRGRG